MIASGLELEPIVAQPNKVIFDHSPMTVEEFFVQALGGNEKGWNFAGGDPELWKFSNKLLVPDGHLLDLGIADCRNSLFFALQAMNVVGYDINPLAVRVVHSLSDSYGLPIEIHQEDLNTAEFEREYYDTILMAQVFNHFSRKIDALRILDKAIDAAKQGGYIWFRGGGKDDYSFDELHWYMNQYPNEVQKVDEDVFLAPCTCSGEYKIEPHLFFGQTEIAAFMASRGLKIIHSQITPEYDRANIMYGEDWNDGVCRNRVTGFITLLAQKP